MDSLRGIPEHIEADFGDAITARDDALLALDAAPGLGPPDLCWLQKTPKTTGWSGGQVCCVVLCGVLLALLLMLLSRARGGPGCSPLERARLCT